MQDVYACFGQENVNQIQCVDHRFYQGFIKSVWSTLNRCSIIGSLTKIKKENKHGKIIKKQIGTHTSNTYNTH